MESNHFWKALAFAIIVTLGMNALDMLFHVATDTAVHLNYVAVKATVIFTTVFLIAWVVGFGKVPGIVTSLLGPLAFYLYYSVATPTLNRSLFTIDDAVGYILVHAIALGIMYWLMYAGTMKKDDRWPFSIATALAALAVYWLWLMAQIKLAGGLDEQTMMVLSFSMALVALVVLFILALAATFVWKAWWPGIVAGIAFGGITLILGTVPLAAAVNAALFSIVYVIAHALRGEA